MSSKRSLICSKGTDYHLHLYEELADGCFYLEVDNQIIRINKDVAEGILRDINENNLITAEYFE